MENKCPYCGPDGYIYGMDNSGPACKNCNGSGYIQIDTTTIIVKIEPDWAGAYKLEYDGKYVTLLGRDRNYGEDIMVLESVVIEVRNATPFIVGENETEILIDLGIKIEE